MMESNMSRQGLAAQRKKQVLSLHHKKVSKKEIADIVGVSVSTVNRYLQGVISPDAPTSHPTHVAKRDVVADDPQGLHRAKNLASDYESGDRDFSTWDLRQVEMSHMQLLKDANFRGVKFTKAYLYECMFNEASFVEADCRWEAHDCEFERSEFDRADMSGATLDTCDLRDSSLAQVQGHKINMPFCYLNKAYMAESDWSEGNFMQVHAEYTDFQESDLTRANFVHARCNDADFCHSNLTQTDFTKANCEWALFIGANLDGTKFQEANLKCASFLKEDADKLDLSEEQRNQIYVYATEKDWKNRSPIGGFR